MRLVPSPINLRASTFPVATIPVVVFVNRIVFDVVFPLSMTPSRLKLGNEGLLPPRAVSISPTRVVKRPCSVELGTLVRVEPSP